MNTKNPTNPRMSIANGSVNVTKICKKILYFTNGYTDINYVKGTVADKDLHNLMNVFRKDNHNSHGRGSGFKTGYGLKILEKLASML